MDLELPERIDLQPFWALLGRASEHTMVVELLGGQRSRKRCQPSAAPASCSKPAAQDRAPSAPLPDVAAHDGAQPSAAQEHDKEGAAQPSRPVAHELDEIDGASLLLARPRSDSALEASGRPRTEQPAVEQTAAVRALARLRSRVTFTVPGDGSQPGSEYEPDTAGGKSLRVPKLDLRHVNNAAAVGARLEAAGEALPPSVRTVLSGQILQSLTASTSHACAVGVAGACVYVWQCTAASVSASASQRAVPAGDPSRTEGPAPTYEPQASDEGKAEQGRELRGAEQRVPSGGRTDASGVRSAVLAAQLRRRSPARQRVRVGAMAASAEAQRLLTYNARYRSIKVCSLRRSIACA